MKQIALFGVDAGISVPVADAFERFWALYPKRSGGDPKKPAKVIFDRKVRKERNDPETIIAGTVAFANYCRAENKDPRFVPMAQTWLSQDRWTCDYTLIDSTRNQSYMEISDMLREAHGRSR